MNKDLFVDEENVDLDVEGYKFKYKPTTAGEENDWLKEYIVTDPETGEKQQDFSKLNQLKMLNIEEAPVTKEDVYAIVGVEKEWKDLDKKQRWKVLGKLRPGVFDSLIQQITAVDRGMDSKKKKS